VRRLLSYIGSAERRESLVESLRAQSMELDSSYELSRAAVTTAVVEA
jgi:hypothetical protein